MHKIEPDQERAFNSIYVIFASLCGYQVTYVICDHVQLST